MQNEHVTSDPQEEPEHPEPRRSDDTQGSIKLGPFMISGRTSILLIALIVVGINLLLLLVVVLAALYRSGNL